MIRFNTFLPIPSLSLSNPPSLSLSNPPSLYPFLLSHPPSLSLPSETPSLISVLGVVPVEVFLLCSSNDLDH